MFEYDTVTGQLSFRFLLALGIFFAAGLSLGVSIAVGFLLGVQVS